MAVRSWPLRLSKAKAENAEEGSKPSSFSVLRAIDKLFGICYHMAKKLKGAGIYDVHDAQYAVFCPMRRSVFLRLTFDRTRTDTVQTSVCTFCFWGGMYELNGGQWI